MPAASLMPAVAEAGTVAERVTRAEGFGHAMTRRKVTRATKTEGRFSSEAGMLCCCGRHCVGRHGVRHPLLLWEWGREAPDN
jgi:hypothetical protein